MIKNITCLKNNKKKDTEPDYRLSVNTGTKEQPVYNDVGAGWLKEGANGNKFISFKLSDAYGERRGWHLEPDEKEESNDVPF